MVEQTPRDHVLTRLRGGQRDRRPTIENQSEVVPVRVEPDDVFVALHGADLDRQPGESNDKYRRRLAKAAARHDLEKMSAATAARRFRLRLGLELLPEQPAKGRKRGLWQRETGKQFDIGARQLRNILAAAEAVDTSRRLETPLPKRMLERPIKNIPKAAMAFLETGDLDGELPKRVQSPDEKAKRWVGRAGKLIDDLSGLPVAADDLIAVRDKFVAAVKEHLTEAHSCSADANQPGISDCGPGPSSTLPMEQSTAVGEGGIVDGGLGDADRAEGPQAEAPGPQPAAPTDEGLPQAVVHADATGRGSSVGRIVKSREVEMVHLPPEYAEEAIREYLRCYGERTVSFITSRAEAEKRGVLLSSGEWCVVLPTASFRT